MRKLDSMLVLLVLLMGVGSSVVLAQDPRPPGTPIPSEPTITETTGFEWVETEDGVRLLVPISSVESVQTFNISNPIPGGSASLSSVTITEMRALEWIINIFKQLWVGVSGSTICSVTADKIYVYVMHKYRPTPGSGSWNDVWSADSTTEWTTRADAATTKVNFSYGMEHLVFGKHQVKLNGVWIYINNSAWGPQRVIP